MIVPGARWTEGADIWIHGRNRDLGGEKPIGLLAAGQFERVLAAGHGWLALA